MRLLVVTNDLPPRPGGIQQYLDGVLRHAHLLDPDLTTMVVASTWLGWEAFDAAAPYEVRRLPSGMLLPTPGVLRTVLDQVRSFRPDLVVFGAALPLGLLAGHVTRHTGVPCMALTHGVEVAVARTPAAPLLTQVAGNMRLLTAVSRWAAGHVTRAARNRCPVELLLPGVDTDAYRPGAGGPAVRARHGLGGAPVCVCVSRLVPRKGQDRLVRAWPQVTTDVPGARLLLVGGGPGERRLRRLAAVSPVADRIVLTGAVGWADLPAHYDAGDVFAMPCRTRWGGLDLEALGLVFLEAAAVGLPVIAGRSGGAPETVAANHTGLVVDGRRTDGLAAAVSSLLGDPEHARSMGIAGRDRAVRQFAWPAVSRRFLDLAARAAR